MKSEGLIKQIVLVFVAALALYVIAYTAIEHRRNRDGPWQVTFTRDGAGDPALLIDQPALGITNAGVVFRAEALPANFSGSVLKFAQPQPVPYDVPFGQCAFMDTTFLPGTVVFTNVFGHEIQLIPRVLTVDKREFPWRSGTTLIISGTNITGPK